LIKAATILDLPYVTIRASERGVLDYRDLAEQVGRRRQRPVIIAATAGTTMTEAVDDLHRITKVLDNAAVRRRFIHVDAALSGIPLALLDPDDRPGFDVADGADCVSVSGHKFLGIPTPCGIAVCRNSLRAYLPTGGYAGSPDTTIGGSRSGHTPLMLWYALATLGVEGLRRRADHARQLATSLHSGLVELGWEAFHHPHAFTVVLRTPPVAVLAKWVLVSHEGWSHVITMPGVGADQVDQFLADLAAAVRIAAARDPEYAPESVGVRAAA
jgi:histidine decarboxylase